MTLSKMQIFCQSVGVSAISNINITFLSLATTTALWKLGFMFVAIDPSLMLHMLMLVLRENYCLESTHHLELSQLLLRHCVPPKGITSGTAVPAAHRAITVQTALIHCSLMVEQTIKWAQSRSVPLCLWEFPEVSSQDCTSTSPSITCLTSTLSTKSSNTMKFSLLSFICSLIQTQINVVYFDSVSYKLSCYHKYWVFMHQMWVVVNHSWK